MFDKIDNFSSLNNYRRIPNIRRTKPQKVNASRLGLQLAFAEYIEAKC